MGKRVLVTGGAGFIGSHLCKKLKAQGHDILSFDSLTPQVHRQQAFSPVENVDIRKISDIRWFIKDFKPQWIFHLAAKVGVGQSQYQIKEYVDTNIGGTANLLDILANTEHSVEKLMVASSMSVYGETSFNSSPHFDTDKEVKIFEEVWPAGEGDPVTPPNVYALTKKAQEDLVMNYGKTYDFPVTALRFFNTYGPGQALSNPYTGVIAIFLSRLLNGKPPIIYGNGQQTRDFISVHDVVDACIAAMESDKANGEVFNVGTGVATTINAVAMLLSTDILPFIWPTITHKQRRGDIRHCYADISKIKDMLSWEPKISLDEGLREVVEWAKSEEAEDNFDKAQKELEERKLV